MGAQQSQVITAGGITPAALTPSASDTVADSQFGPNGVIVRVITTTTATNFSVSDSGVTPLGNAGTVTPITVPTGSVREFFVPRSAINLTTSNATLNFSATTGVTYELKRA